MEHLRALLPYSSILAVARATAHYTVDTHARDKQIGCVLLEEQPAGPARPAGYWSKALNDKEVELPTAHREYFAVVRTVLL